MMTEEDTFDALRRTPYTEMYELWLALPRRVGLAERDAYFLTHGWIFGEFVVLWAEKALAKK